jgi:predicted nucleic acid-binding protein
MRIAVKDANVFIDMELMGLFELWASLGYETLTTTMITQELERGNHREALAYIETDQITVIAPDTEEVEIFSHELGDAISIQDASVLLIALQYEALLLTGDKKLRTNANLFDVKCHGSIWILEQLILNQKLSGRVAAEKLQHLTNPKNENMRFLPTQIVEECLRRWRKG